MTGRPPPGLRIQLASFSTPSGRVRVISIGSQLPEARKSCCSSRRRARSPVIGLRTGNFFFFIKVMSGGLWDLWALPFSGDRKPFPIVKSPFNETHGQFSPDGRWIVYVSDESGTPEIPEPFRPSQSTSTMLPREYRSRAVARPSRAGEGYGRELFSIWIRQPDYGWR